MTRGGADDDRISISGSAIPLNLLTVKESAKSPFTMLTVNEYVIREQL